MADIGIDFGTSRTVLFSRGKICLEQPSVAAVDTETWEPLCFGDRALAMLGRAPENITVVRPLERGVIADYDIAEQMLAFYMREAFGRRVIKPRVMISVPIGITPVQHRSVADIAGYAGGRGVCAIESPIAAALGLGADFTSPGGYMVVDIGAGTTDIATVSMGGIVRCGSGRTASGDFDEAITRYVRREFSVTVGSLTASRIKEEIGCAVPRELSVTMRAKGRNVATGMPAEFEITSEQVLEALDEPLRDISLAVRGVLEKTPPDIVADISARGIYLTGGGSLLYGLSERLTKEIGVLVIPSDNPRYNVVRGELIALKKPRLLKNGDYAFRSVNELIVE